ncbi:MAG: response regulator [Symplocastrum torsivum CPER-KK1]|uniref:Phosphoenolpyruvate synthase n=1 Tax=Symplocastrum torsivum CPER-KK1 TaxID=450513 RepID=A0A951PMM1_9CYAN|nr:response regulator [Symplocastrum torsivum CPER-KK1]
MDNLYWLDQIQRSERPLVGNQAFNLSQLLQRGYPVVPGFVVPAIAFWECMETLGKSEPLLADLPHSSFYVDVDNPRQLQLVAQQLRQELTAASLPAMWESAFLAAAEAMSAPTLILHPSLSIRSLNQTFDIGHSRANGQEYPDVPPGIWESYICPNQADALQKGLKQVWAELFRARSLFYWQRNGIGLQQLSVAVLVQPLWDAIASGTLLASPVEWTIQATWGLGIAIAKGEVLPDQYQLTLASGTVQTRTQRLGSKTRAYHLYNLEDSEAPIASGVQPYLLSEEQQKQYALDEKSLNQLIDLSQRLATEISPAFSLEWALCQIPGSPEPQLQIMQLTPQLSPVGSLLSPSSQPSSPSPTPQLVRGLPAAAGRVIATAQVIPSNSQNLTGIIPGRILIVQSITPSWLPLLKQAAAVVTEQGGMTSHAAIIARELGIPAVVGAIGVTQLFETGESLLVDGDQGEIHRVKDPNREVERSRPVMSYSPLPPIATQLLVNLSQVNSLEKIIDLPVDGVGLLRSELIMLDALENLHPNEWLRQGNKSELVTRFAEIIIQFAAAFAPRPVLYRSIDWREAELAPRASHEVPFLSGVTPPSEPEVNPIVGLRGTLRYLIDPTLFDLELAALKQVQAYGYSNVQLMLPFIRAVEEFTFCRRRVEQAGLTENPHFQLWIMAEVPSVLFLLPDYVRAGVQGISIGTNDLTQLLLAVDRDQERLGSTLDGRHPAVQRALQQLIQMARQAGIPCSICGQAPAQYPELIDALVEWGITSISVDVNDVERIYNAIARAEQRLLLEAARKKINN